MFSTLNCVLKWTNIVKKYTGINSTFENQSNDDQKKIEKNLIFKAIFADFSVPDDSTSRAHLPSKAFLPS